MANFDKFITPNMLSLTDSYAVKILICYFLQQIGRPITPNQLTEIATSDGTVNYFVYTEAVEQMLESGTLLIEEEAGESYYVLSETGRAGAEDFKKIVPKSFRDKMLSSGLKFFAKLKNDNDVKVSVSEQGKGYSVNCICTDGGIKLMELILYAPDEEQARMLADKIMLNPTDFYAKVIDFASNNQEYEPDTKEIPQI